MSFNTIYLTLMSVRMAPRLPLIFLLMIHGVSSAGWGVSYSPSHICALKNSSVIMSCTYTYPTGYKIKKVFWTKNPVKGKETPDLSEDPEYSQRLQYLEDKQQNCTIRLSHVTQKDQHMYCFRFITDIDKWTGAPGVTLAVTDLQVEAPERVTEGHNVSLTCKSSCNLTDRATFIWYRNSQPLTERRDRNNQLLLQSVRREDAGRYNCALHGHSYISPAAHLSVTYPPSSVSVSISPSVIVEGDSVTLSCSSDPNPPAEISWFKGGTFVGSGRMYSISKISSDHSEEYKCKSINEHGEKYSDAVTLNVMYPPRSVSVSISPSVIVEGDSVTLSCSSDSNPPALNFSWFKGGMIVGSGRIYNISKISSDHSEEYKCRSINEHGQKDSAAVTLNVMYPPRNVSVSINGSGEIVEGHSVTMICSSDSNPPALNFSWFKGGTFVGSGRIYSISNISSDHSGEYKCRSINKHGEKYSDAVALNVMYPPKNVSVSINGSGVIVEGDSVTLICSSDSNPPALNFSWFSWFRENQSSAVGSGQSFSALQSGRFYCEAHNQHGSQRSDAVTVTVHPGADRNVIVITATSGGVFIIIIIIIIIILFIMRKRSVKTDLTMKQNDLYADVSQRVSVHDESLSEPDPVNDALYASVKPSRFRGETPESRDTEEIQYATVQYHRKKERNRPEEDECQYDDIRVHQPDAAERQSNVQIVEDAMVIYSSVK
ncbi:B-cell receptor CD22-like [Cyprinus carpio]|uniref:B-cell receptor CD22-like n=1 Tax=Cyprinus carpio TaxID=7962 RepID=A0A9R0B386_CYPCA|nr:B-cell receptor CD22-like [Cyprinus carpio]